MAKKKQKAEGEKAGGAKGVSVAAHPRARVWIARARARTALAVFTIVLVVAWHGGVAAQDALLRALVAGVVANLVAWAVGVALWRQIVVAEIRAAHRARDERRRARAEALRAQAEAGA